MTVRVDEPRGHDAAGHVQHALDPVIVDGSQVADREDPVAEHADIGAPSGGPGAVDDGPAAEQQVEGGHRAMVTGRNPTSPNRPAGWGRHQPDYDPD